MNPNDPDASVTGEPADPLVGRTLADRYRILSKLGEGAMGTVYLGEHLRMGRRDAIKVLRGGLASDTEAIARFTRGARNVSAIRHSNVCAIYDFSDTAEGLRYLAMEYIEGETLRDTLERETRLDPERAVEIACQVAGALQAAHDAGVVHRDLKPGNIMLCTRPGGGDAIKVVDFDIAKGPGEPEGEEVTRVGFVVGTPEYMSPEQLTGERLDGRSDLYSLGVVLYRMITGVLPFRAVSAQEIMVQRLTTDALSLSDTLPGGAFPLALEPVLARALARNAAHRHPGAAVFADELRAALAGSPSAAAPASTVPLGAAAAELPATRIAAAAPRPVPAPRTNGSRSLIATAAIAVVAILGIGATVLLRDSPAATAAPPGTPLAGAPAVLPDSTPDEPAAAASEDGAAADAGVAESRVQGAADQEAVAQGPPARDPAPVIGTAVNDPAVGISADPGTLLERLLGILSDSPSAGQARATRDTAMLVWNAAVTRRDSAAAAFVLAQSALTLEDDAECALWTQRGAALDRVNSYTQDSPWSTLLQVCR